MISIIVFMFIVISIMLGKCVLFYPQYLSRTQIKTVKQIPISIIIPAKNEAPNLRVLIESIKSQTVNCEIIVVNDQSTDNTSEILKDYDVIEVVLDKNPWNGKSYVCYQGAKYATHETILFMDADIAFTHNQALEQLLSLYSQQHYSGIISVQPRNNTQQWFERLSALFSLSTIMGVNTFSIIRPISQPSTVFGPVNLTNQTHYFQTGGHAASKDKIIEGEGLYNAYHQRQLPIHLYLALNSIGMQLYPDGVQSLISGWSKHIARGSTNTHPVHMLMIIMYFGGGIIALIYLLLSLMIENISSFIGIITYCMYGLAFYRITHPIIRLSVLDIFIYPIYILFFFIIYGWSWYQINILKRVVWKGKSIRVNQDKN